MYDKLNENRGILNDYDLAHLAERDRPSGFGRTGTMPFMALDLLAYKAWKGEIEQRYRHDCESFAWVLLWICCRYEDGKEIPNAPLSELITDDYNRCYGAKLGVIGELKQIAPTPSYKEYWDVSVKLVNEFFKDQSDRVYKVNKGQSLSEPKDCDVVQRCREALKGKGVPIFADPSKGR